MLKLTNNDLEVPLQNYAQLPDTGFSLTRATLAARAKNHSSTQRFVTAHGQATSRLPSNYWQRSTLLTLNAELLAHKMHSSTES